MRIDSFLSRLSVLLVAGAFLSVCPVVVLAQQAGADAPTAVIPASSATAPLPSPPVSAAQIGTISGTVADRYDESGTPGAEVTVEGPDPGGARKVRGQQAWERSRFDGLKPNVAYRLTIQAKRICGLEVVAHCPFARPGPICF